MPPPLQPPGLHFHKLKKRTTSGSQRPAAMARRGLASILYKLRDVHRPPSSPSSSSPSPRYRLCYPPPPSAWAWPSCRHPRTSSFRAHHDEAASAAAAAATMYRTVNTVYDAPASEYFLRPLSLDEAAEAGGTDRSFLAVLPEAVEEEEEDKEQRLHETAVVCAVRSERLFFDPAGAEFLSKQEATVPGNGEPALEAVLKSDAVVAVTVESEDPHGDFRASMAEMVAAHGLRDWAGLEELLAWYLKLNGKGVHGVIVGAFVDLLVSLTSSSSPSSSSSCITFEESCS